MKRKAHRLEHLVVRRYGDSAGKRIGLSALLAAAGVLVRQHPRTALHMAAAGAAGAGRAGLDELKGLVPGRKTDERRAAEPQEPPAPRLSRAERKRFVRYLKQQARDA